MTLLLQLIFAPVARVHNKPQFIPVAQGKLIFGGVSRRSVPPGLLWIYISIPTVGSVWKGVWRLRSGHGGTPESKQALHPHVQSILDYPHQWSVTQAQVIPNNWQFKRNFSLILEYALIFPAVDLLPHYAFPGRILRIIYVPLAGHLVWAMAWSQLQIENLPTP